MTKKGKNFSFEISLSVLNHLGRNLYRNFITVLGEAISNSWDADASNVSISFEKNKDRVIIKDDGSGMNADDFQNKFLKIGYSKRSGGKRISAKNRPYIGRKGIGKLALLSCAERITVISRKKGGEYVGGIIDNSGLDRAITQDLTPEQYPLGAPNYIRLTKYTRDHTKGTIIIFEGIKSGVKNSLEHLTKSIALNFRFSLIDKSFKIQLQNEVVSLENLSDLAEKTQFVWNINKLDDPYLKKYLRKPALKRSTDVKSRLKLTGFIASVVKPRDLKILGTEERVSVDLFVNGRLREKDILKHMPTSRVVENYLYGQIHFNELDDSKDRFTSSREGVISDDPKYRSLLTEVKKVLSGIVDQWDSFRLENREEGDADNPRLSTKQRKSRDLFQAVSQDYLEDVEPAQGRKKSKIEKWVDDLGIDAQYNFSSYAECFISENLVRRYILEHKIPVDSVREEITKYQGIEKANKEKGNVSIDIRKDLSELSYLSMDGLAKVVDGKNPDGTPKDRNNNALLIRDAQTYKPMRDAVAHTALLTDIAKRKLTSVYDNVHARVDKLLPKD